MIIKNASHQSLPIGGEFLAPGAQTTITDEQLRDRFVSAWIDAGLLSVEQVADVPESSRRVRRSNQESSSDER